MRLCTSLRRTLLVFRWHLRSHRFSASEHCLERTRGLRLAGDPALARILASRVSSFSSLDANCVRKYNPASWPPQTSFMSICGRMSARKIFSYLEQIPVEFTYNL